MTFTNFAKTASLATMLALSGLLIGGLKVVDPPGKQLETFADSFLQTLDPQQTVTASLPFDDASRPGWHFIPKDSRKGLPLQAMNDSQRTAALRLVRAALSQSGYAKVHQIRILEGIVAEFEGEGRRFSRDPDAYHLTLFGEPGDQDSWGMSFEGHHVSINLVCRDGKVVDTTPQFLGTHPAVVPHDYTGALPGGTRILAAEEDLGFELLEMLTPSQKTIGDHQRYRAGRDAVRR